MILQTGRLWQMLRIGLLTLVIAILCIFLVVTIRDEPRGFAEENGVNSSTSSSSSNVVAVSSKAASLSVVAKKYVAPRPRLPFPIVMYHFIEDPEDTEDKLRSQMAVSPAMLESQLKLFKKHGFQTHFVKEVPVLLRGRPLAGRHIILTFDDGYEDFYSRVFPLLKKYDAKATVFVVNHFLGKEGYLTHGQIEVLLQSGLVEIGSHTTNHTDLMSVGRTVARKQIQESKEDLEKKFNVSIASFSYPFGALSSDIASMVHEAGYTCAVAVTNRTTDEGISLIYALPRLRAGVFMGPSAERALGITR